MGKIPLEGWDRSFLNLSSKMTEPFCISYGLLRYRLVAPLDPQKFENSNSQIGEIATRIFIGLGAFFGVGLCVAAPIPILGGIFILGAGSKALRALGFALQKDGYTHVRGIAPEKIIQAELKVMNWNICGIGGGMSLDHGGVIGWRSRLDAIVDQIKKEDPDVLILQEIYDTALGEALIEQLKTDYAHFFMHLGPNVWGSVGGCMVISKCIVNTFANTSFSNNKWDLNRGFAMLELKETPEDSLPCVRIIGTHLIHGDTEKDQANRMAQVAQIINHVALQSCFIPTILTGDLNIERDQEGGALLSSFLQHAYQDQEPTSTNQLVAQWDGEKKDIQGEIIDYISLLKTTPPVRFENCHLIEAFDSSYNTKTARSDHHGLAVTIEILEKES